MRNLNHLLTCLLYTLFHSISLFGADITWAGGNSGNWNAPANWAPATVPTASDKVFINTTATINIDIAAVQINGLSIIGNSSVVLSTTSSSQITIAGAANAFVVENGSALKCFTNGDAELNLILYGNTTGAVNGTLILEGTFNNFLGASLILSTNSLLTVNGTLQLNPFAGYIESSAATLSLAAGAHYIHNREGGIIPQANYNISSTVELTGTIEQMPSFDVPVNLGNLVVDLPHLNPEIISLGFIYNLNLTGNINGDFKILNTNGCELAILFNGSSSPVKSLTVGKNFEIAANSPIQLSFADFNGENKDYEIQVNGNFVQNAGTFSLQGNNFVTGTSKLSVKGNFVQTGGTFTATSTATSTTKNLFLLEINGSVPQAISSWKGTVDNAANMVALRINNTAGGVNLQTPLSVGRIDLQSGILSTTVANALTINGADNTDLIVSNGSVSSYVSGPLIRHTHTPGSAYLFPVGKSGMYRPLEIIPQLAVQTTYMVDYFRSQAPSVTVLTDPLWKLSNAEYWVITRGAGGSDAAVQLLLAQAVAGAQFNTELVVAGFNGSGWESKKGESGTSIIPGNVSSGVARSEVLNDFNIFTFGIVPTGPLPVILLDFAVKKNGASANLTWKIDPADIPQSFEILRSADGINFNKTGEVNGSDGVTNYSFTDALQEGNNYYRLRIVEKNGTITLSKVLAANMHEASFAITGLAPTLVKTTATLTITAASGGRMDLYITDISGRLWRKFGLTVSAGNSVQQIDLSDLSSGAYQLAGYMNGEKTAVIRFIKE